MECVTSMINRPFLKYSIKFQQSRVPDINFVIHGNVLTGSRPVVTSSKMTSFGSPIVDKTILNLRLIPPENAPTLPSRRCHNLTRFNLSSPNTATSSFPTPLIDAYNRIYHYHRHKGKYMFKRRQFIK